MASWDGIQFFSKSGAGSVSGAGGVAGFGAVCQGSLNFAGSMETSTLL
jgi:hypothetical protein